MKGIRPSANCDVVLLQSLAPPRLDLSVGGTFVVCVAYASPGLLPPLLVLCRLSSLSAPWPIARVVTKSHYLAALTCRLFGTAVFLRDIRSPGFNCIEKVAPRRQRSFTCFIHITTVKHRASAHARISSHSKFSNIRKIHECHTFTYC